MTHMGKANKNKDKITIQHLFEARFLKKNLDVFDARGALIQKLLKDFSLDRYSVGHERVEVLSDDSKTRIFISSSNFGFQIEDAKDFACMRDFTKRAIFVFSEALSDKEDKSLIRVGVKSSIYFHPSGYSYQQIEEKYKNLIQSSDTIFTALGGDYQDIGFDFVVLNKEKQIKSYVKTGPMQAPQLFADRFFDKTAFTEKDQTELSEHGFFLLQDAHRLYQNGEQVSSSELQTRILEQIDFIEVGFNKFRTLLLSE